MTRFVTSLSNDSTANIWQGVMENIEVGTSSLQQAASLAAFSNSEQELADKIALAYSKIALAIGSEAVTPLPAIAAQERSSSLVARVPAAPLFTLVIANLLFVVLGIILAVWRLARLVVRSGRCRLGSVSWVLSRTGLKD